MNSTASELFIKLGELYLIDRNKVKNMVSVSKHGISSSFSFFLPFLCVSLSLSVSLSISISVSQSLCLSPE